MSAIEEHKKAKDKAFVKAFAEVLESANPYADAKEEIREVDVKIAEKQRLIGQIEMEIKAFIAQREQKEKEIREIIRDRERQKALKMDEIVNNVEEKPHRSEVEDDPALQAKRQEEFNN